MVSKQTCPRCKGNKVVYVTTSDGHHKNTTCPQCGGNGFQIKVSLPQR